MGKRAARAVQVSARQVRGSVQGSVPEFGLDWFGASTFGTRGPRVRSGVQVRGSVQGSGPEFGLEFRFGVRFSVQGSGPEFSLELTQVRGSVQGLGGEMV